jgi:predicted ATPase
MSTDTIRSRRVDPDLGASIAQAVRQNRGKVLLGSLAVAVICAVLALGGAAEFAGMKLEGLTEPWARWLVAGLGAASIVVLLVVGLKVWPRTIRDAANPLPADGVPWVDRPERELLETAVDSRRITPVVGRSGAGKSRLVRELVRDRWNADPENRPRYVDLRNVADYELLLDRLILQSGTGRSRRGDRLAGFSTWIGDRPMLLVLDNCDGELAGVTRVVERLTADCPKLRLVLTSQKDPNLGADPVPVHALECPGPEATDPQEIGAFSAVKMLLVRPGHASLLTADSAGAITSICTRVEGLPSALEVAGSALSYSSPQQVDAALGDLRPGLSPLRGLLDLTYARLDETQQRLFRRLSVFAGPFTDDDVVAISSGEPGVGVLAAFHELVDRQLVTRVPIGDPLIPVPDTEAWFRLIGPFRRYGIDLVQEEPGGAWDELRRWHATGMLEQVERAEPHLTSPERDATLGRLRARARDIDAALQWSSEFDTTMLTRFSACLFWYWNSRGELQQGEKWLTQALEAQQAGSPADVTTAHLEYGLGGIAFLQGEQNTAVKLLTSAAGTLATHPGQGRAVGLALLLLGRAELERGDLDESHRDGREAVLGLEGTGEKWALALALNDHAERLAATGEWESAREHYSRSLSLWDELQDQWGESLTRNNLAAAVWRARVTTAKDHAEAHDHIDRALKIQEENGYAWGIAWSYRNRGELFLCAEDVDEAGRAFSESLDRHHRIGRLQLVADCVDGLGRTAARRDDPIRAARLLAGAELMRDSLGVVQWPVEAVLHEAAKNELTNRLSAAELEKATASVRNLVTVSTDGEVQADRLVQLALESAPVKAAGG